MLSLSVHSEKGLPGRGLPRYPKRGFGVKAIQSELFVDIRLL